MTCFVFSTLKLEISFKISVLSPSETAWRYDLFCVFMMTGTLAFCDHDHDHEGGDDYHAHDHNHDFRVMLRSF